MKKIIFFRLKETIVNKWNIIMKTTLTGLHELTVYHETIIREIFSESCKFNPSLNFHCTFPIDLAINENLVGAKSIGNV